MSDLRFDPESLGTLYCAVFGVAGGYSERMIDEHAMGQIEAQIETGATFIEFDDICGSTFRLRASSYIGTHISTAESRRAIVYLDQAMLRDTETFETEFQSEYGWRPKDD